MVTPYNKSTSKKREVEEMFDNIASSYDYLNHSLSFSIDRLWRRKLVRLMKPYHPAHVLDLATGTGDLAIAVQSIQPKLVTGVDLSAEMLKVAQTKIEKLNLTQSIELSKGDAETLLFDNNTFDASMIAFGVRNFDDLEGGLLELYRTLKPGAPVFILEFSQPTSFPMKQLYHFYSFKVLPIYGKMISKDERAYSYLPESIKAFPFGDEFLSIMQTCGFINCKAHKLSSGIATIYIGHKQAQ